MLGVNWCEIIPNLNWKSLIKVTRGSVTSELWPLKRGLEVWARVLVAV